jgi:hypothetical protein
MQMLHERSMLKSHLTPRAAATVVLGLLHGRVIAELDTDPVAEHDWNTAMLSAFSGLFQADDSISV